MNTHDIIKNTYDIIKVAKISLLEDLIEEVKTKFCYTEEIKTPNWEDIYDLFFQLKCNIEIDD